MEFHGEDHHHHEEGEGEGEQAEEEDMEMSPPSYDSMNNSSLTRHSKLPINPIAAAAMDVEPQSQRKPRYRECLKNHAVGIGAHAVDGCGEFLPAGADGTLDALKCAACNCHRNFHRKETHPILPTGVGGINIMNPFHTPPPPPPPLLTHYSHAHHQQFTPTYFRPVTSASPTGYLPPPLPQPPRQQQQQQQPLALPSNSSGGGGGGEQEGMNSGGEGSAGGSMKRFRTKFTAEQKEKMVGFAERLGWRIQKEDEEMVQQFCNENGLKRHVLKVWMHNNKHTIGKKP